MGGASSAAGAGAASSAASGAATNAAASGAASGAAQNMTQQYMQKYGYNPYEMAGKSVMSAADKIGQGVASQQSAYSPEMNRPIFAPFQPQMSIGQGGGMFSGSNFANSAQRRNGL
jgi:hypothetical protein